MDKNKNQLLKGYQANGSTIYFDDILKEQFEDIRNKPYNTYWQSGEDVDNDFYTALYNANLPDNSPLRNKLNLWTEDDWNTARDLFMNSPEIRQNKFKELEEYWKRINSPVTPVYKKGGSLQQDYRAWEKEIYDSYKCGGKTKKKSCGGEMKPKKKACGGMKVKK